MGVAVALTSSTITTTMATTTSAERSTGIDHPLCSARIYPHRARYPPALVSVQCNPACLNGDTRNQTTCSCLTNLWTESFCKTGSSYLTVFSGLSSIERHAGVAICNLTCQNGGACSSLQTCTCPSTYSGATCQNRSFICILL